MEAPTQILMGLQSKQDRVRNMCILAHVDHGKTTLADHLIGSNGLIHPRLMGELRYLDSREDEQARGITMKSSSISLLYVPGAAALPEGPRGVGDEEKLSRGYLVNLIDSPGHVDFCSEVSTAVRLSDGGLVVVDAVEGVCIQTHAVLRQAWEEKVKPCLFINKIDRLCLELRLTPQEAARRLEQIVTHANMIMSAFQSEKYMSEADSVLAYEEAKGAAAEGKRGSGAGDGQLEGGANGAAGQDEEEDVFQPTKGNVAFGSAFDGWAFRLDQFADMYAEKLGCRPEALTRAMWGDWHFSPKEKRVVRIKSDQQDRLKSMFVQFALEPIWKAYTVCDGEDVATILGAIVKGRNLSKQVGPKALEHPEPKQALRSVLRAWLPLSDAVLGMAVVHMPGPAQAAPFRVQRLMGGASASASSAPSHPHQHQLPEELCAALPAPALEQLRRVESALASSSAAADAPCVVYVSKMVSVPASALPRQPGEPLPSTPSSNGEVFLAFGRVFAGVAREGQTVHVLSPTYSPAQPQANRQPATMRALYMMMGRGLERLHEVPAGNVLAIAGLDTAILKSATLSTTPACRPLAPMVFQAAPIVKVAIEPAKPSEMPQLVEGLRLLNRADPFVEVSVMETGEHVLGAAGEVHLETCIKDLRERFARVELQVSPPLVAFRETVFHAAEAPEGTTAKPARVVEASTPNGCLIVRVRAHPLPAPIASALEEAQEVLRHVLVMQQGRGQGAGEAGAGAAGPSGAVASSSAGSGVTGLKGLREKLEAQAKELDANGARALALLRRAWLLGPKGCGPNLLLCHTAAGETDAAPAARAAASAAVADLAANLFDTPAASVVRAAKQHHQSTVPGVHAAASGGAEAAAAALDAAHAASGGEVHDLTLGHPRAAELLGWASLGQGSAAGAAPASASASATAASVPPELQHAALSVESGVVAGFQIAASAGPLCEEPMWGVAFEIDARFARGSGGGGSGAADGSAGIDLQEDVYGPFSGQVMTAVAAACRRAMSEADPRLCEAMYLCEVQASAEALSGVYAVLGRRRARILREEMREGSDTFLVHAYLPVEASFGLADNMRRQTSGAASASLMLSHWERLQVDPFFVPTTEEEREEFGEEGPGTGTNLARRLIDAVRRRKGLAVEEKVVKVATKQRTLKRNV